MCFMFLLRVACFKICRKTRGYSSRVVSKIPLGNVQKYPQLSQLMIDRELIVRRFEWQGDKPSFAKVEG